MKKGHKFIHNHPMLEKELGLDQLHVIVDRDDWEKAQNQAIKTRNSLMAYIDLDIEKIVKLKNKFFNSL